MKQVVHALGLTALVFSIACATSPAGIEDDAAPEPTADAGPPVLDAFTGLGFWEECEEHADCDDMYCYYESPAAEIGHCTEECTGICPDGYACRVVQISEGTDMRLCVPADETFCDSCTANQDCGDSSDFCIMLSGGNFCTIDCSSNASVCPTGFTCQSVAGTGDTLVGMQCMPLNGVCCVDADGDFRGQGSGCVTTDCDDANDAVYDDAAEICDGYDNDCVGGIDVDPGDCAEPECQLGALGYFERLGEPCESGECTEQSAGLCDLYTCDGGGEDGDACADACDGEENGKCIPSAHCDASVCYADLADGQGCDELSDCTSNHCQNDFCCAAGDCCQAAPDCPTYGTVAAICDDPPSCQGSRGEAVCTVSFTCASTGVEPDDSACNSSVVADECDWYLGVSCTGAVDQSSPSCPTSCLSHADCDPGGHCNPSTHTCIEDLDNGGVCDTDAARCKSAHCQNGFCCNDGDCCQTEHNCPASYANPPECTVPTACQGDRDVAQCLDNECSTSAGVDDDSACGAGILADDCGPYLPIYCDGNSVQPAPTCPDTCISDLQCDADAYCSSATGTCVPDEGNGQGCEDEDECISDYCSNGFCCDSGVCCAASNDCDAFDVASNCNDAATCQGTRVDGVCSAASQCTTAVVDDDSGCAGLEADDCGPYLATHCSAAVTQSAPPCDSDCSGDGECDPSAHCDAPDCIADSGPGGYCDEPSDCDASLYCVDNVCCNSECAGSCEACDLVGSEGTCTAVPGGQDPDGECGAIGCASYYHGWGGDTCYRRADVSAAAAMCSGSRSCRSAAVECGASGQGGAAITCDDYCQNPSGGTCTGTTAGTCYNVSQGSATCGYGVCQTTMPVCLDGVDNPCVPNSTAASTETCNNIDDNCDNVIDNGSFSDGYEPNASCSSVWTLPTIGSDQNFTINTMTIYGYGDNDYYRINAEETDASCSMCGGNPFDEDYQLTVWLTVPSGAGSYQFCTGSSCDSVSGSCQVVLAGQTLGWTWTLDGGCPGNDEYSRYYRIYGNTSPAYECSPYILEYSFTPGCF